MEKKERFKDRCEAQLEEYRSLRQEIMSRQNARLLILGFTVTAIGTIIGLALQGEMALSQGLNHYVFALIIFAIVLIIAALVLTIHHTQQIDVIGAYIRKFIEPQVAGLDWQTRWTRYRESKRPTPETGGVPLGTSKPLALYYAFLTISSYSATFVIGLYRHWGAFTFVLILALCSLACSYDLYKRKTKGWRINWDMLDE